MEGGRVFLHRLSPWLNLLGALPILVKIDLLLTSESGEPLLFLKLLIDLFRGLCCSGGFIRVIFLLRVLGTVV